VNPPRESGVRPTGIIAPGDRVALIAPASPYDAGEFERGRARLEALGYEVVHRGGHQPPGHLAAQPARQRLAELHEAFDDDSVTAVIAIRGGYGVMELLDGVDWDLIAANPKPLVGLSDLTPLLNAVVDRCGFVTLHGPMVVGLGRRTDDPSVDRLLQALTMHEPLAPMEADGEVQDWCLAPGVARGRTCGGNLSLIAATTGTPYQLRTAGRILLLEDVAEPPYRVHRMLIQLRLAGLFDACAAIAFGEMLDCKPPGGAVYDLRAVVHEALAEVPVPMLWGLPFGHGTRNQTVPLGVAATLDADRGRLTFHEPAAVGRGATDD